MAVDPIRPIDARPDGAGIERVHLTRIERDEQRRERERRRKRRVAAQKSPTGDGRGGVDLRA